MKIEIPTIKNLEEIDKIEKAKYLL